MDVFIYTVSTMQAGGAEIWPGAGAGTAAGTGGSDATPVAAAATTTTGASRSFSVRDWEARLRQVRVDKRDINRLVMNYFVVEGYADAAAAFASESGMEPGVDLSATQQRLEARALVEEGRILEAIQRVNALNPEVLDSNPTLHFRLQKQRLIELIRQGCIEEAITLAQAELAPLGQTDESYLEELERAMALLIYDTATQHPDTSMVQELLDERQRTRLASELNAAILANQNQEISHKLPRLIRLMRYAERDLRSRGVVFPELDLETGVLRESSVSATSTQAEPEPMADPSA